MTQSKREVKSQTTYQQNNEFLNDIFSSIEDKSLNFEDAVQQIKNSEIEDKFSASLNAMILSKQTPYGNDYLEAFENHFFNVIGFSNKKRIEKNKEPIHFEVLKTEDYDNLLKFSQTTITTGGGNNPLPQISRINQTNIIKQLLFETGILADVTMTENALSSGYVEETLREYYNIRTATVGNETTETVMNDNTADEIKINANNVWVSDGIYISQGFSDVISPINAANIQGMLFRSIYIAIEKQIFGANSGTTDANFILPASCTTLVPSSRNGQCYSLFNNLAVSGVNRGIRMVSNINAANTGWNHIDALNNLIKNTVSAVTNADYQENFAFYCNLKTANEILTVKTGTGSDNLYYFNKDFKVPTSLGFEIPIKIVDDTTLLDYQVVFGKMKNVIVKMLKPLTFISDRPSAVKKQIELVAEIAFDAAPQTAFKNIPKFNTFTAGLLQADGVYTS